MYKKIDNGLNIANHNARHKRAWFASMLHRRKPHHGVLGPLQRCEKKYAKHKISRRAQTGGMASLVQALQCLVHLLAEGDSSNQLKSKTPCPAATTPRWNAGNFGALDLSSTHSVFHDSPGPANRKSRTCFL
jgi:hypothetical protein